MTTCDENRKLVKGICDAQGWDLKVLPAIPGEPAKVTVVLGGADLVAQYRHEALCFDAIAEALIEIGGPGVFEA